MAAAERVGMNSTIEARRPLLIKKEEKRTRETESFSSLHWTPTIVTSSASVRIPALQLTDCKTKTEHLIHLFACVWPSRLGGLLRRAFSFGNVSCGLCNTWTCDIQ